jgi:hypothetical protein
VVITTLAVATTGYPVTLIVITGIGSAMALASSLGRWLLVLLVIAAWPFLLSHLVPPALITTMELYLPSGLGFVSQAYLLPAALLAVFAVAARRDSRRSYWFPPTS